MNLLILLINMFINYIKFSYSHKNFADLMKICIRSSWKFYGDCISNTKYLYLNKLNI